MIISANDIFKPISSIEIVHKNTSAWRRSNKQGVTILLVEQNVYQSLRICHRAYVMETGRVVLTGKGDELLNNDHIKKAFLGM